jgi:hypothetical protein
MHAPRFTCRLPDLAWVTDRHLAQDDVGSLIFWNRPSEPYREAEAKACECMVTLLQAILEIQELSVHG